MRLRKFLKKEYSEHIIYPSMEHIFTIFKLLPISEIKVVILGQDCYHEPNQALGVAFGVPEDIKTPPSLVNIKKEIVNEYGKVSDNFTSDLSDWVYQGVFLLNTVLTVREHEANSHAGHGWEIFTDEAIKVINDDSSPKVFMLWGNNARSKKNLIDTNKHLVLESAHPSPLSANRGFFGNNHFVKANEFLRKNGIKEIVW